MKIASWSFRLLLFAPWLWFVYEFTSGSIGADPAKALNHKMGETALYMLALNLIVGAAIAYSFRFPKALRFLLMNRRWLGVVTFIYLVFHFLLYLTMEGFEAQAYAQIFTKLYLALGTSAFVVMLVLAATSNDFSVRRLGFKKWKRLHRIVYPALALITAHVMLIEKADLIFYGILFGLLWLIDLPRLFKRRASR